MLPYPSDLTVYCRAFQLGCNKTILGFNHASSYAPAIMKADTENRLSISMPTDSLSANSAAI
jgi:hypothetical protein